MVIGLILIGALFSVLAFLSVDRFQKVLWGASLLAMAMPLALYGLGRLGMGIAIPIHPYVLVLWYAFSFIFGIGSLVGLLARILYTHTKSSGKN